jgi:hypothetical protein
VNNSFAIAPRLQTFGVEAVFKLASATIDVSCIFVDSSVRPNGWYRADTSFQIPLDH